MITAEYFRDQGLHSSAMDSVTRFSMAQRESDVAASRSGKGDTPTVFAHARGVLSGPARA